HQLVHPQLVGVVERLGPQDAAPESLGRVAGVVALEGDDPAVLVAPGAGDDQLAGVGVQDGPGGQALVAVGREPDDDLAAHAVGPADLPDVEEPAPVLGPPGGAQSSNSTSTSVPSRTAAARTTVRMACATRPRLPITRPMS